MQNVTINGLRGSDNMNRGLPCLRQPRGLDIPLKLGFKAMTTDEVRVKTIISSSLDVLRGVLPLSLASFATHQSVKRHFLSKYRSNFPRLLNYNLNYPPLANRMTYVIV